MRQKFSPTIRDVAREAGVSTATVSHVFNKSRWVSPETQQLVLEAARKLNYRPSAIARSLSTQITHTVGVVVADITNPYFAALVRGLEDNLWSQGYNVIVCNTDEQPAKEARYLQVLLERRVDGMIIAPTSASQPYFSDFLQYHIPIVFVDRRPAEYYGPIVEADNFDAGYQACQHLVEMGHRRIAFVGRNLFLSTVIGRHNGYRQCLIDHNLPFLPELVRTTESTIGTAYETCLDLLQMPDPPTAMIAANHNMTVGMFKAIQALHLRCPEDVSVVSFDDHPWAPLFTPPLTVIKQPVPEISQMVVKLLLDAFEQNPKQRGSQQVSPVTEQINIQIKTELIRRSSCQPLAEPGFSANLHSPIRTL